MAYTTINKPTDYFNTKLYTGNDTGQSITGVGFQPDWVWIKSRSDTNQHNLFTPLYTGFLESDTSDAVNGVTNGVTAYGADGFTVGNRDAVNDNNLNFVSWNWKAGGGAGSANTDGSINTTNTSVNTTAGFSICKWSGTGSAGTIGHGLGAVPKMIICKNTDTAVNWIVYHNKLDASAPQDKYIELNATTGLQDYPMWNDTAPTSSVFSVGSDIATNKSGSPMIAYCFAEKQGYSKFGSYTGNGNADGSFIYTGFKPAWVMIKRTDDTANWSIVDVKRDTYNSAIKRLNADQSNTENTSLDPFVDIISNGFKLQASSAAFNGSGGSYIYMAFAEAPLVGTNGVTAKAR